ncbi:unnamed protein product, partial [Menidia menidia]
MITFVTYGLVFANLALPGLLLGDLAFRCPSCSAEHLTMCPKVAAACPEIVREPGCGCCPVCARQEGELCGVYTPRCSTGLRCYPSMGQDFPLHQLIQGLGRCGQNVDVHGTENPLTRKPPIDAWYRQESARKQHQSQLRTKMRIHQSEDHRTGIEPQSPCQEELNRALEEISKMTSEDNRGPLENLYELKFPNCDKDGLATCPPTASGASVGVSTPSRGFRSQRRPKSEGIPTVAGSKRNSD